MKKVDKKRIRVDPDARLGVSLTVGPTRRAPRIQLLLPLAHSVGCINCLDLLPFVTRYWNRQLSVGLMAVGRLDGTCLAPRGGYGVVSEARPRLP